MMDASISVERAYLRIALDTRINHVYHAEWNRRPQAEYWMLKQCGYRSCSLMWTSGCINEDWDQP